MASDRMTVRAWVEYEEKKFPSPSKEFAQIRAFFAEGTERVEKEIEAEGHHPPKRFRPFEWREIWNGWFPAYCHANPVRR